MNKNVWLAALLAVCLTLTLCACSGGEENPVNEPENSTTTTTTTTTAATAAPTAPTPADGEVLYTIKVVDTAGAPVEGVYVQLCLDVCVFAPTDSEGVAYFCKPEAEYKVAFTEAPDDYYYFEDGSTEMTLTYDLYATETTDSEPITNDAELSW